MSCSSVFGLWAQGMARDRVWRSFGSVSDAALARNGAALATSGAALAASRAGSSWHSSGSVSGSVWRSSGSIWRGPGSVWRGAAPAASGAASASSGAAPAAAGAAPARSGAALGGSTVGQGPQVRKGTQSASLLGASLPHRPKEEFSRLVQCGVLTFSRTSWNVRRGDGSAAPGGAPGGRQGAYRPDQVLDKC